MPIEDVHSQLLDFLDRDPKGECPLWFPFGYSRCGYAAAVIRNFTADSLVASAEVMGDGDVLAVRVARSGSGNSAWFKLRGVRAPKPQDEISKYASQAKYLQKFKRWAQENLPEHQAYAAMERRPGVLRRRDLAKAKLELRRAAKARIRELARMPAGTDADYEEVTL